MGDQPPAPTDGKMLFSKDRTMNSVYVSREAQRAAGKRVNPHSAIRGFTLVDARRRVSPKLAVVASASRRDATTAFTLVELLVVIAIIGVLVA
jgi:prepilin-type N-terminal cleavage/methylation domain-containing protein